MVTDRDLIIGLFEAIGRLAKELTGHSLGIKIVDSETGKRFRMRTPTWHSYLISDEGREAIFDDAVLPSAHARNAVGRSAVSRRSAKASPEEAPRRHQQPRRISVKHRVAPTSIVAARQRSPP